MLRYPVIDIFLVKMSDYWAICIYANTEHLNTLCFWLGHVMKLRA